jgi:hypothetical protein
MWRVWCGVADGADVSDVLHGERGSEQMNGVVYEQGMCM